MENAEIKALKERIERLETAKGVMAKALFQAWRYLIAWENIETSLEHHRPSVCVKTIDAAIKASHASDNLEEALRTLRDSQFPGKPADGV